MPSTPEQDVTPSRRRLGLYWQQSTFDAARAAYVADLNHRPGAPLGFAAWVEAALIDHVDRTPRERADLAAGLDPESARQGIPRPIWMDRATITALEDAVREERGAGRMLSQSALASEAIRLAIASARDRSGGTLPPPPARLPNKPIR
ncbi:hypothetical protein ACQFYA_20830 [Promicromonospora sp. Marseille-Q5078]